MGAVVVVLVEVGAGVPVAPNAASPAMGWPAVSRGGVE